MVSGFEHEIYKSVVHNAALFLKEGVKILFRDGNFSKRSLNRDTFVLAASNIQIAMELAIKSYLIYHKGLKSVVISKQANKSIEELERLYRRNLLKSQEFNAVCKQLNGLDIDISLPKSQRQNIERFQQYRNQLIHLACNVENDELGTMRDSLLIYSINTVMFLMFDQYQNERPTDFMSQLTNWDYFQTLQHSPAYRESMKSIAVKSGESIVLCPLCEDYAYSKDEEYCYVCGFNGYHLKRTDCKECGGKNTVIYDKGAHLIGNPNLYQGYCQKCEAKNAIFECPDCGIAYHYYFEDGTPKCYESHCISHR